MNDNEFDRWIYESESDSLDFKRDQYQFIGADDTKKSELLKDILAMANSWRRTDGYIIIGIQEKPEKPNDIIGITDHIDDATLQQFVNSKTSGICRFEYKTFSRDGLTLGVIKVPVQKRPVYLKNNFGKLKADTVYVRRGSSTTEAKLDEISIMGREHEDFNIKPYVEIAFYDVVNGKSIGTEISTETTNLIITDNIPKYYESSLGMFITDIMVQHDYYSDLIDYINFKKSYVPICFALTNTGDKEAVNIRVELVTRSQDLSFLTDADEPALPVKKYSTLNMASKLHMAKKDPFSRSAYSIDEKKDKIIIFNSMDRLHAKRTIGLDGTLYIQLSESGIINLLATIFYDGQSTPYQIELNVKIECKQLELTWEEFSESFLKVDKN